MEVVNGADRLVMDNSVLEGSSQQEDKMDGGKGTEGKSGRVWAGKQGRCFPSRHVRNTSKRKVTDADLRAAADSGNKWDKYWHEREKKKKKRLKCLKGTAAAASDSAGNALKPERVEETGHEHSSQMKAKGLGSALIACWEFGCLSLALQGNSCVKRGPESGCAEGIVKVFWVLNPEILLQSLFCCFQVCVSRARSKKDFQSCKSKAQSVSLKFE